MLSWILYRTKYRSRPSKGPRTQTAPPLRVVDSKYNRTSPDDHNALEIKATCMALLNHDTLDDYVAAHRTIGSQMMIAATYPAISHECTSIKFIMRGLLNHLDVQYVLTTWAIHPPTTIQDLHSITTSMRVRFTWPRFAIRCPFAGLREF